jgi:hypothetical protein
MPEPPPSLSVTNQGSEVWVSWPAGLLTYTLQTSSEMPATTWTPITTGISQTNGIFTYKAAPSITALYRLKTNYQ